VADDVAHDISADVVDDVVADVSADMADDVAADVSTDSLTFESLHNIVSNLHRILIETFIECTLKSSHKWT